MQAAWLIKKREDLEIETGGIPAIEGGGQYITPEYMAIASLLFSLFTPLERSCKDLK